MTGPLPAIVLAGGLATRLGGGDKPLRTIAERPMLSLVLERLAKQAAPLAISANGDAARFAEYGLPVLADEVLADGGEQSGPLSGILSGMRWAGAQGYGHVLTVAGDTPFFPFDLASRLVEAVGGEKKRGAVASSGGRNHPVFALWPVSLEGDLRRFLSESQRFSVAAFLDGVEAVSVPFAMQRFEGEEVDPFFNVNTPEDLMRADAIARGMTR